MTLVSETNVPPVSETNVANEYKLVIDIVDISLSRHLLVFGN